MLKEESKDNSVLSSETKMKVMVEEQRSRLNVDSCDADVLSE